MIWPPVRWRWLNRWYARALGYFWLPCPICGKDFGSHETLPRHVLWHTSSPGCDTGSSVCYKETCYLIALALNKKRDA